jgi:hypothetical protein
MVKFSPSPEGNVTPVRMRSSWLVPTNAAFAAFVGTVLFVAVPAAWFFAAAESLGTESGGFVARLIFMTGHWSLVFGHVATPLSLAVFVLLSAWRPTSERFWHGLGILGLLEAAVFAVSLLFVGLFSQSDFPLTDVTNSAKAGFNAFTHEPWWPWWPFAIALILAVFARMRPARQAE